MRASESMDPWRHGFSIVHRETGRPVGTCGFKGPPADSVVEIAYGIDPEHQGKGYATEAAEALTSFAFAQNVRTVRAHTLPKRTPRRASSPSAASTTSARLSTPRTAPSGAGRDIMNNRINDPRLDQPFRFYFRRLHHRRRRPLPDWRLPHVRVEGREPAIESTSAISRQSQAVGRRMLGFLPIIPHALILRADHRKLKAKNRGTLLRCENERA